MAEQKKNASRGVGRVAFLARLEDFRKKLDEGYPARAVYDEYQSELGIGYPQFTRYINRYIRKDAKDDGHQKTNQNSTGGAGNSSDSRTGNDAAGNERNEQAGKQPGKKAPFEFNAESGNKRDDLI
ncbi:TraK family protein [Klebsiella pneumoniae]|nr:TraK family protein [Salmonella enterica subsp. enterica serovar Enteritidis]EMB3728231.1 hypothetical protein [Escherichia coli]HAO0780925.1 TraK family protein [Escherichia coli]